MHFIQYFIKKYSPVLLLVAWLPQCSQLNQLGSKEKPVADAKHEMTNDPDYCKTHDCTAKDSDTQIAGTNLVGAEDFGPACNFASGQDLRCYLEKLSSVVVTGFTQGLTGQWERLSLSSGAAVAAECTQTPLTLQCHFTSSQTEKIRVGFELKDMQNRLVRRVSATVSPEYVVSQTSGLVFKSSQFYKSNIDATLWQKLVSGASQIFSLVFSGFQPVKIVSTYATIPSPKFICSDGEKLFFRLAESIWTLSAENRMKFVAGAATGANLKMSELKFINQFKTKSGPIACLPGKIVALASGLENPDGSDAPAQLAVLDLKTNGVELLTSLKNQNGTTITIYNPEALATDLKTNSLYVVDNYADGSARSTTIYKMQLDNKEVIAVAGEGSMDVRWDPYSINAQSQFFADPQGIAVNPIDGTIVLADTDNHRILSLKVALDSSGKYLYSEIKSTAGLDPNGSMSGSQGGPTHGFSGNGGSANTASLNLPKGVSFASDGTLYFSDTGNQWLRKIDTKGGIYLVAGVGINPEKAGFDARQNNATSALLNNPSGQVVVGSDLYFADSDNGLIRKVDTPNGEISTVVGKYRGEIDRSLPFVGDGGDGELATLAQFANPQGVLKVTNGEIYIADTLNHRIRSINGSGILNTYAGTGVIGNSGDGGDAKLAQFNQPRGMAQGPDGSIYLIDYQNKSVRRIVERNGFVLISTVAGKRNGSDADGILAVDAKLVDPVDIAVDMNGDLFIADRGLAVVRKVNSKTNQIVTFAGIKNRNSYSGDDNLATSAGLAGLQGIAVDSNGNLFMTNSDVNKIRKVDARNGVISSVSFSYPVSERTLSNPKHIRVSSEGDLLITDSVPWGGRSDLTNRLSVISAETVGAPLKLRRLIGAGGVDYNSACGMGFAPVLDALGVLKPLRGNSELLCPAEEINALSVSHTCNESNPLKRLVSVVIAQSYQNAGSSVVELTRPCR